MYVECLIFDDCSLINMLTLEYFARGVAVSFQLTAFYCLCLLGGAMDAVSVVLSVLLVLQIVDVH